jgi:catechol 2,3-dioxygenase-like lactoylglutathione lyase family enzyme
MLNMQSIAAVCGLWLLGSLGVEASAQLRADRTGAVVGTGAVTGFVENMDRSLAFYHDAFGMEIPPLPDSGARPYNPTNAQLFAMFDIPGAVERHQFARLPGSDVRFELMEIQNVEFRTIPLRLQDPGTMTLVFLVRDVGEALQRAKRANADVVTPGGSAVRLADGGKGVLIRDVDGRFIELRELALPPGSPAAQPAPITAMRLSIAVADMARTLEVYRDVLGFTVEDEQLLGADPELRALTGLPTADFRRSIVSAPGSSLRIELVEYRGIEREAAEMRIQDRGAARLQLRAENIEALVAAMRDAGLRVVSKEGGPVPIPPNFMGALVADPNNFFLTPFAPCDDCAPRLLREGAGERDSSAR